MGGGVHEALAAQMQRDGVALPDHLAAQPSLSPGLLTFMEAFYELDTERNHQFALARIPWSKMVAYANEYGHDRDELVFLLRRMDDAHLDRLAREAKSGGSGGTQQVVQRPPRPDS